MHHGSVAQLPVPNAPHQVLCACRMHSSCCSSGSAATGPIARPPSPGRCRSSSAQLLCVCAVIQSIKALAQRAKRAHDVWKVVARTGVAVLCYYTVHVASILSIGRGLGRSQPRPQLPHKLVRILQGTHKIINLAARNALVQVAQLTSRWHRVGGAHA